MANKRISDLPEVTSSTVGDVVPIDGTTTRKITVENMLDDNLVAIKGLTSAANKGIQFTGLGMAATYDLTPAGKALLDDADAAAQRVTLGLGGVQNVDTTIAANINFNQTGTGSVARSVNSKLTDFVSVLDFGAVGNGSADDTTAIQNAINAAQAAGQIVFFPPATYKITSALSITNTVALKGSGRAQTTIKLGSSTQNGIQITGVNPVYLSDLGFSSASGTQTAGSAIVVDPGGSNINYLTQFDRLQFNPGLFVAIDFERAALWALSNSFFNNVLGKNLIVRNIANVDDGDSLIVNNHFQYHTLPITSGNQFIYWESSGGLKIIGNKFNGGFRPIYFSLASGANTGSNIIVGNSIESFTGQGIFISSLTSSPVLGVLSKTTITGNEIGPFDDGIAIQVFNTSTTSWLDGIAITGNTIHTGINGGGTLSGQGINIDYATGVTITGNNIKGNAASTIGVVLSSNVTQSTVSGNTFYNLGTTVIDNSTNKQGVVLAADKTLTANNSLILAGTDGTTMTFPSSSTAVPGIATSNTFTGSNTFTQNVLSQATYRGQGVAPGIWLDETDGGAKGAYVVLDTGAFQVQRRSTNFGAFEASPFQIDVAGAPTGALTINSAGLSTVGGVLSSSATAGVGYATGAGGTVTQATSKTTGVTLNKVSGSITMNNAALASASVATFTLTNSTIAATDTVVVQMKSGGTTGSYFVMVESVSAGSCQISVRNYSGGSLAEAIVLSFNVIKGSAS